MSWAMGIEKRKEFLMVTTFDEHLQEYLENDCKNCEPVYNQRYEVYSCAECSKSNCPHWKEFNEV